MTAGAHTMFIELARQNGSINNPTIRQGLMKLHTAGEIGRYTTLRMRALKASGGDTAGAGNLAKLSMSEIMRRSRDVGLAITGPYGTLHAYDSSVRRELDVATGNPMRGFITGMALFAQAPPIYGGTDQVQRNILGERVLGLPKEPNNDRTMSWSDLPKKG